MMLRHCTAAGGTGAWWRYDAIRKTIWICLTRGSCHVDVCSLSKPRYGAYPIVRIDESTWKILPVRYTACGATSSDLVSEPYPVIEALGTESVHLLDAGDKVASELAEL